MEAQEREPLVQLPPPSVGLTVLAHTIRLLEEDRPGFTDRLLATLEDEMLKTEIIRLRGPKVEPEVQRVHRDAVAWLSVVRLATLARLARLARRVKKRKR